MKIEKIDARIKNTAKKPARLALFGGSFDPVHSAHLKVAHCALKQVGVDYVVFIPASRSPLKDRPSAGDADRLQMLRLALQGESRFKLNTFEIEQDGMSFTIDTVDHFRKLYGSAELFWIIGEDQFARLNQWRRIGELAKKVIFLVYPRLGSYRMLEQSIDGLRYQLLEAETMPVSSTQVRKCCERGLKLKGLVPGPVEAFICQKGLYKKGN